MGTQEGEEENRLLTATMMVTIMMMPPAGGCKEYIPLQSVSHLPLSPLSFLVVTTTVSRDF